MWGLAPDYQMLQADGQGEERTRLMVALIGLQKAPKPGNRKKENFPDCTRHQINRAAETQHTAPGLGGEFQSQAGGSISAARLIEMGFRRGEQNYIYITTMQNRLILFSGKVLGNSISASHNRVQI